jgi:hypothetical protein
MAEAKKMTMMQWPLKDFCLEVITSTHPPLTMQPTQHQWDSKYDSHREEQYILRTKNQSMAGAGIGGRLHRLLAL